MSASSYSLYHLNTPPFPGVDLVPETLIEGSASFGEKLYRRGQYLSGGEMPHICIDEFSYKKLFQLGQTLRSQIESTFLASPVVEIENAIINEASLEIAKLFKHVDIQHLGIYTYAHLKDGTAISLAEFLEKEFADCRGHSVAIAIVLKGANLADVQYHYVTCWFDQTLYEHALVTYRSSQGTIYTVDCFRKDCDRLDWEQLQTKGYQEGEAAGHYSLVHACFTGGEEREGIIHKAKALQELGRMLVEGKITQMDYDLEKSKIERLNDQSRVYKQAWTPGKLTATIAAFQKILTPHT